MEKSLILFLSWTIFFTNCTAQTVDCFSKEGQEKLVESYHEKAWKYGYNHPMWHVYYDSLIAECPNIADAYREKAIPYIKNGDYAAAMPLEDKAVELAPKEWMAYRGFLKCIFTKDFEGAIIDFKKAQEYLPNNYVMDHTYFFFIGISYLEMGELKLAEENMKKDLLLMSPEGKEEKMHFNSLFYMGLVYYEMKDYEKAIKYLTHSVDQFKEFPDANYYLAVIYLAQNDEIKAKYHLDLAKSGKSKNYGISEDNVIYCNYPHEITSYEIGQLIR
jgi:tetratricopeptide (TPR) repeat protein